MDRRAGGDEPRWRRRERPGPHGRSHRHVSSRSGRSRRHWSETKRHKGLGTFGYWTHDFRCSYGRRSHHRQQHESRENSRARSHPWNVVESLGLLGWSLNRRCRCRRIVQTRSQSEKQGGRWGFLWFLTLSSCYCCCRMGRWHNTYERFIFRVSWFSRIWSFLRLIIQIGWTKISLKKRTHSQITIKG